jgi:quercetin dioxygenase-like cupin family protein
MSEPVNRAALQKPGAASRVELIRRDVAGDPEREAVLYLLSLPPGGAAPAHRHPCTGVGYVLEGVYESQYEGETLQRFVTGDAIYDLADAPHHIARNGSDSEPLRLLMTFVVRKGEPTVLPL